MYRILILIIIILGIILINKSISKEQVIIKETSPRVEYRYLPRTFAEEQMEPVYPSEIFETMFSQPSPWLLSIRNYDQRKQEKINAYFVSQM